MKPIDCFGTRVHLVKNIDKNGVYIGMNQLAAYELHIPWSFGEHDVVVLDSLPLPIRDQVVRHEKIERDLMRLGLRYKAADAIATNVETVGCQTLEWDNWPWAVKEVKQLDV